MQLSVPALTTVGTLHLLGVGSVDVVDLSSLTSFEGLLL